MTSAPDGASAAQGSTVAGQRRDARQGGDLLPTQPAELRQFRQQCTAGDRPDAWDALQQIVLGPPERARADSLVQIPIDAAELALEPANVVGEAAPDRAAGMEEPILFGDQHFDELAPARHQRLKALARLVGKR